MIPPNRPLFSPSRGSFPALLWIATGLFAAPPLAADTVTLKSGKVYEEVEVTDQGDKLKIVQANGSSVVVPKSMVAKHVKTLKPPEELQKRRSELKAGDVKARLDLARWCDEKGFPDDARRCREEAVALDPSCAEAHQALHHVPYRERWYISDRDLVVGETERAGREAKSLRDLIAYCDEKSLADLVSPVVLKLLEVEPDDIAFRKRLGHVRIGDHWHESLGAAADEFEKDPEAATSKAFLTLGEACREARDWATLCRAARAALRAFSDSRSAWTSLLAGLPVVITDAGDIRFDALQVLEVPGVRSRVPVSTWTAFTYVTAEPPASLFLVRLRLLPPIASPELEKDRTGRTACVHDVKAEEFTLLGEGQSTIGTEALMRWPALVRFEPGRDGGTVETAKEGLRPEPPAEGEAVPASECFYGRVTSGHARVGLYTEELEVIVAFLIKPGQVPRAVRHRSGSVAPLPR
ncbi:MAG: hypothetical protein HYY93_01960 [Planctomycetes bacterium]|nr:hypothetical protein [Planctomycetota bacterium]